LFTTLTNFYKSQFTLIAVLLFIALGILAWHNRFIQDDAFISFRYADNFVQGKGLVWNEGERVEGYTNFLWTIIVSFALFLKLDPVKYVFGVGLFLFELTLFFVYRLAAILFHSRNLALLSVLLLGTNYSFSSYATGGLETQLQACLFAASLWLFFSTGDKENWSAARLALLSLLAALAIMTRLDSVLVVGLVLGLTLIQIFQRREESRRLWLRLGMAIGPLVLLVGGWLIWKMNFYGSVLPNSFYVKVASLSGVKRGLIYVYLFFYSYWLVPFPFLFLAFANRLRQNNRGWLILAVATITWLGYVIFVAGDFMEFRFLVPVLPYIFMGIVWLTCKQLHRLRLQVILVLLVLCGSIHHYLTFSNPSMRYYDVDSISGLSSFLFYERNDWIRIGQVLGEAFPHDRDVTIAVTAAGAIPYYSQLKTIDILGINDQWIARHGEIPMSRPGHQRRATLNYLIERKVNLLIGHPQLVPIETPPKLPWYDYYFYVKVTPQDLPAGSKIIEIPINSKYKMQVLSLVESPVVNEAIQRNGWVSYSPLPEK
jgi:hypothetical protein